MDLVELTEFLVKKLVKEPDMVSVKAYDDDEEYTNIEILVSSNDMGAIIGKGGNIANSIRTIVQASAYVNGLKKVRINIDSF